MTLCFAIDKRAVEDRGDWYVVRIHNPEAFILMALKAMANPDTVFMKNEEGRDERAQRRGRGRPY